MLSADLLFLSARPLPSGRHQQKQNEWTALADPVECRKLLPGIKDLKTWLQVDYVAS